MGWAVGQEAARRRLLLETHLRGCVAPKVAAEPVFPCVVSSSQVELSQVSPARNPCQSSPVGLSDVRGIDEPHAVGITISSDTCSGGGILEDTVAKDPAGVRRLEHVR